MSVLVSVLESELVLAVLVFVELVLLVVLVLVLGLVLVVLVSVPRAAPLAPPLAICIFRASRGPPLSVAASTDGLGVTRSAAGLILAFCLVSWQQELGPDEVLC